MDQIGINRSARFFISTVALAAALFSSAAVSADKDVVVTNVPLPVTGTVNANVTNAVLPVSGIVGVSSLPSVTVSILPPVSLTLPEQPFFDEMTLLNNTAKAVGVVGQRLGVTTLTITNFDSNPQQLFVFNPVMSGGSCSGSVVGGATPIARALLEARKTVQLQFPTPMVFSLSGQGCIAAEVTTVLSGGSVVVDVIGFAAP